MKSPEPAAHDRVLELLKRYGWNSTSFQALEPGLQYWFDQTREACVAYADTGAAWVAAGAPLAPEERLEQVTLAFVARARGAGRRVCFFATEDRLARRVSLRSVPIGEQPVWDPARWPEVLSASRGLREQLRRARVKGVTIRRAEAEALSRPSGPLRREIEALVDRWLARRQMAPMGFLVQVSLFEFVAERRVLVAERAGSTVGFLAMVPVYARSGWLIEDLLRDPSSPNGTTELMVDEAMRLAAGEGSRYVTLGLAPLSGAVGRWLRLARALGSPLYSFHGVHAFKARLHPRHWVPIYLSFPAEQSLLMTLFDVLAAFLPQGMARFAVATLCRAPQLPVRGLAALLVPWTLLLAAADTERWFPSRLVQSAWVLFDMVLCLALAALGRRWRPGLAALLAVLTAGDAALTLFQLLLFNLPRARSWLDVGVSLLALAGPLLASAFLWVCIRSVRGEGGDGP